jgi:hypothetical protein
MAAGDVIMSGVDGGAPAFPCGPCRPCRVVLGNTLSVVVSGIGDCQFCFGNVDDRDYDVTVTNLNGTYTVTWDTPGSPFPNSYACLNIGTIIVNKHDGASGSLFDPCHFEVIDTAEVPIHLFVSCADFIEGIVASPIIRSVDAALTFGQLRYFDAGYAPLGTAMENELVPCLRHGTFPNWDLNPVSGGHLTILG